MISVYRKYLVLWHFLLLIASSIIIVFISVSRWTGYENDLRLARNNNIYVDEFGGFIDVSYIDYLNYARQNRSLTAVEDYWGLWSALNRTFSPCPADAVIHALGNLREICNSSLESADLIVTTNPTAINPGIQTLWTWIFSHNFWFYDDLIVQWEPSFISPTTVVWKRAYVRSAYETVQCLVSSNKRGITIRPSDLGVYKVTLGYSSTGKGWTRYLLHFENNISFFGVSLPPGAHEVTIPVLITQKGDGEFVIESIGEADTEVLSCTAERILYRNDKLLPEINVDDFFLTDQNWRNGIARRWAGFFLPNTSENREKFREGGIVVFQNGEQRKIIAVSKNGPYLNVWVEGDILVPENVGSPDRFRVLPDE